MKTRYRMRNPDGAGFVILIADILLMFVFVVLDMKPADGNGLMLAILIGFAVAVMPGKLMYRGIRHLLTKKYQSDSPNMVYEDAYRKADITTRMFDILALLVVAVAMGVIVSLHK